MLTRLFLRYGYALIFVAAGVEGDATLLAGSFLAQRGYFNPFLVGLTAAAGTIAANQVYYWLGRRSGHATPAVAKKVLETAGAWLSNRGVWVAFVSRFAYGLRIAIPLACGVTRMPPARFAIFDAAGAILWAAVVGTFGTAISHLLERAIEDLYLYERYVVVIVVVLGIALLAWYRPLHRARALFK